MFIVVNDELQWILILHQKTVDLKMMKSSDVSKACAATECVFWHFFYPMQCYLDILRVTGLSVLKMICQKHECKWLNHVKLTYELIVSLIGTVHLTFWQKTKL